jgi:uncharacterized membrane protein YbhN (UPF0104 family)
VPAAEPARRLRPIAARVAAVAVAAALLWWMTRGVDFRTLAGAVRPAPWWAWSATVAGLCASYVLRALRIHAELSRRHPVRVGQCLEVMLVHNAAVNVLPMRGGEAAYPWLVHRRLGVPLAHAVGSLVWMRVQDVVVLAFLAAALWPGLAAAVRLASASALAVAVLGGLHLLQRGALRAEGAAPRAAPLRAAHAALQALALAPRHGWQGWVFCAGSWTVKLASLGGLLAALAGLGAVEGATGALGGELAGVLPVQGPAGLGTYEAGVWAGAALRGRSAVEIAAPAIAVHLLAFATALAAGGLAHALSRRHSTSSPASGLEHDHA